MIALIPKVVYGFRAKGFIRDINGPGRAESMALSPEIF
jgi:hypothetical protein